MNGVSNPILSSHLSFAINRMLTYKRAKKWFVDEDILNRVGNRHDELFRYIQISGKQNEQGSEELHGIEVNSSETMADEVQMPHDVLSSLRKTFSESHTC